MNVKIETLPHSQALVTVEVEAERMAAAREETVHRIAKEMVIPGFRKGKAPYTLVERYVRADVIEEQAERRLVDGIWKELRAGALKDMALFDTPKVNITQHNPLVLEITLTLQPSVQLGDYRSVRVAPELVTVSDKDVDEVMAHLRDEQAQWQPVEHRPVREGDLVSIQVHGTLGDRPIAVPQGYSVLVSPQTAFLVPGFAMRLLDMEIGEEKEFVVEVPHDADNPALAGARGTAIVTVQEIKEKVLPALDDNFAKSLGHENLEALRDKVRSTLQSEREEAARARLEQSILDAVAGVSTVSFPDVLVENQTDRLVEEYTESLRQRGLDMEVYLHLTKTTREQMRQQLREVAAQRIRNYLLVEELGRAEGIVIEESAVSAESERLASLQDDPVGARRTLSTSEMHDRIRSDLYVKTLFDRLIEIATQGQEPVSSASPAPSATGLIIRGDEAEGDEAEKATEPKQEKPKLIIATH